MSRLLTKRSRVVEQISDVPQLSQLNIYLLTLSDEKMSDSDLLTAIAETPPNCLILIEGQSIDLGPFSHDAT